MASTSPDGPPRAEADRGQDEMEPLLGRRGDVNQAEGRSIAANLVLGTAILAQFGISLLLILILVSVFLTPPMLFWAHPVSLSLSLFLFTQSILLLQPTHLPLQKLVGQRLHASLNGLAFLLMLLGVAVIEYNKISQSRPHFHVAHAYLGVATASIVAAQFLVGVTMWAAPGLYGGEARARAVWKYHRWSGYLGLLMMLATVVSATRTPYNEMFTRLKLWAVLALVVLVVLGVFPRIQKQKMGLARSG